MTGSLTCLVRPGRCASTHFSEHPATRSVVIFLGMRMSAFCLMPVWSKPCKSRSSSPDCWTVLDGDADSSMPLTIQALSRQDMRLGDWALSSCASHLSNFFLCGVEVSLSMRLLIAITGHYGDLIPAKKTRSALPLSDFM